VDGIKPTLLINDYSAIHDLESIKKSITENHYYSISRTVPMCRFRGTVVDTRTRPDNMETILGWQRNVSRIRSMDVSMPTLISLTVNDREEIMDIELDASFRGSKGLLCSRPYLDTLLKKKLIGLHLDTNFLQAITVNQLHCFHLVEVLSGVYSYYRILKNKQIHARDSVEYEEEVMDCFIKDDDCYACSSHVMKGENPIFHTLKFHDIFRVVNFDKAGNLKGLENVKIDFFINGSFMFSNDDFRGTSKYMYRDFLKFILNCINELKPSVCHGTNARFLNTNLVPGALIGLIVQCIAMQTFKNNYNYVMHALTALQRPNHIPLCLGAIKNKDEAHAFFEGYDFENLLS